MTTHSSSLASADPPVEEAEPNRRTSRFDERGIALQTVIIMVVLLAIAGGVAAVLLSRGQSASNQLEQAALAAPARTYTNESFCRSAGLTWGTARSTTNKSDCKYPNRDACVAAGGDSYNAAGSTLAANGKHCYSGGGDNFLGEIV